MADFCTVIAGRGSRFADRVCLCLGFYVTPAVLGGGKVILVSMQITAILERPVQLGGGKRVGSGVVGVNLCRIAFGFTVFEAG